MIADSWLLLDGIPECGKIGTDMAQPNYATANGGKAQRDRRKVLVEREILDRACTLFAEHGYRGTSLTGIADSVGLTRAAIYHYFRSKEDLLGAIMKEVSESPLKESAEWRAAAPENPVERLRSYVRMRVRGVLSRQVQMKMIVVAEASMPAALATRHAEARRQILAEYRGIIAGGIKSGDFRPVDDRLAALAIIGMVTWTPQWFNPERGMSAAQVADTIADLAVQSVAAGPFAKSRYSSPGSILQGIRDDLDHLAKLTPFST